MRVAYLKPASSADTVSDQWLTRGREYVVLELLGDGRGETLYRVMADNRTTPILKEAVCFKIVDPAIPQGWAFAQEAALVWHLAPEEFLKPNFWVRYFDGEAAEESAFDEVFSRLEHRGS